MEKIEIINQVIKKWGLTPEKIVQEWTARGIIKPTSLSTEAKPFAGINFVPSKKFIPPKTIEPGMFYYSDGLIFSELIEENQVAAVVGCVEKNHGLALGLLETSLPWSSDLLTVCMAPHLSGKEATEIILETARKQRKRAEAVQWCASYAYDGIETGTMFLPSRNELIRILVNYEKLIRPLSMFKSGRLHKDKCYWSSSDCLFYNRAWTVLPSCGCLTEDCDKDCDKLVRGVLEF